MKLLRQIAFYSLPAAVIDCGQLGDVDVSHGWLNERAVPFIRG